MKIGDRVLIVGDEHPWKASVGTIAEPFEAGRLNIRGRAWVVELDAGAYPGHSVAAAEDDLRTLAEIGAWANAEAFQPRGDVMANREDVSVLDQVTDDLIRGTVETLGMREDGKFAGPAYDAQVIADSNLAVARAVQALGVRLDVALADLGAHLGRV